MVRQNIQVNLMFCTHLALFLTEERFDGMFITLSAEILGDDDLILAIQSAGGVMWKKTAFAKTSLPRKIPNQRRTCWSIAPMVQMLSIRCILSVRSSRSMIFMGLLLVE